MSGYLVDFARLRMKMLTFAAQDNEKTWQEKENRYPFSST